MSTPPRANFCVSTAPYSWSRSDNHLQQLSQAYRRCLDILRNETGLPAQNVLDVRGNHDTFNVGPFGGPFDFYPLYGAMGAQDEEEHGPLAARGPGAKFLLSFQRVHVRFVLPTSGSGSGR